MKLLIPLLLLAATVGRAQESTPAVEPYDKPGKMHELLGKAIGDWDVEVAYTIGGVKGKSSAKCHAEWMFDGLFLSKAYTSEMMGKPFLVQQTIGYDSLRKEFFEWQIESNNTGRLETTGKLSADGTMIVCTGPAMDPATLKPAILRTVTRFVDADTYVVEWWMKVGDAEETQNVTLTHKRRK